MPGHFPCNTAEQRCGCSSGRPQTDCSQTIAAGNDEVRRLTLRQAGAHDLDGRYKTMTEDKQCLQRYTTEGRCLEEGCGKNMLDVCVIPRCMMSTTGNECLLETTCRNTVTFATKVCCARTLFKAKFLFGLVLNTTRHAEHTAYHGT